MVYYCFGWSSLGIVHVTCQQASKHSCGAAGYRTGDPAKTKGPVKRSLHKKIEGPVFCA
jgi:hypothetical protein